MYFLFQRQSHKNAQLRTMQKASAAFLENCQLQLVTVRHIIYRLLVFGRNPLFASVTAELFCKVRSRFLAANALLLRCVVLVPGSPRTGGKHPVDRHDIL